MKRIITILVLSFVIHISAFGQYEILKDSLDHPTAIAFHEELAFVSLQGTFPNTGKLISFEIDNPIASCTVHFDSLSEYPRSIVITDNTLFLGFTTYIAKVDLEDEVFSLDVFTSDVFFPRSLKVKNNVLYIAEEDRISFIDLSSQNTIPTPLLDKLENSPLSLDIKNDYLYFTELNQILKVDLTSFPLEVENVMDNLENNIYSIKIVGKDLYFDQTFNSQTTKKILKFNIENPTTTLEVVASNMYSAIHINHYQETLYFVSPNPSLVDNIGRVYELNAPVISSNNSITRDVFSIYPNPTNQFLRIENLNTNEFLVEIRDLSGNLIKSVSNRQHINVEALSSGIYLLNILSDNHPFSSKVFIKN